MKRFILKNATDFTSSILQNIAANSQCCRSNAMLWQTQPFCPSEQKKGESSSREFGRKMCEFYVCGALAWRNAGQIRRDSQFHQETWKNWKDFLTAAMVWRKRDFSQGRKTKSNWIKPWFVACANLPDWSQYCCRPSKEHLAVWKRTSLAFLWWALVDTNCNPDSDRICVIA